GAGIGAAWHASVVSVGGARTPKTTSTGPAPRVSVVAGDEELLVERAVARLVAAAGGVAGSSGRAQVRDMAAAGLQPGELATLTAPSLFGESPVIVIRGAQDASKDLAESLTRLAADPPPGVTVVITHAGGAKGKALLTTLARQGAHVIECPKITR